MPATPSASYSLTVRVEIRNRPGMLGKVTSAISRAGGDIGAIDLIQPGGKVRTRDITFNARDDRHGQAIVAGLGRIRGVSVLHVSDRTFLMHLGGKIEVRGKVPVKTRDDLSMAYTPGVARVCMAIHDDAEKAYTLTIKQNSVAVVTDGTAVLGLGDIGPKAAMPVMEGKALLFKAFADVDAFPLCLDTKDADEIVRIVRAIAPGFGGINLEDIAAPRCFDIEERLRKELDIPVFHDDQHGTAVVVLAALLNALKVVKKKMSDVRVVFAGAGASGIATARLLMAVGCRHVVGCDRVGMLYRGRADHMNPVKAWFAEHTNPRRLRGSLADALRGADVFIGLSGPGVATRRDIRRMARESDRVRHGEPDAGSHARGSPGHRPRHGDRALRLSESDQQRALLPGVLPRAPRCPRSWSQRRDEDRGRPGDRRDHPAERDHGGLRDSLRVRSPGGGGGRRRCRGGGGADRCRPPPSSPRGPGRRARGVRLDGAPRPLRGAGLAPLAALAAARPWTSTPMLNSRGGHARRGSGVSRRSPGPPRPSSQSLPVPTGLIRTRPRHGRA